MMREEIIEKILRVIDKNVIYYEELENLIEEFNYKNIDIEELSSTGKLYEKIECILNELTDSELSTYAMGYEGLELTITQDNNFGDL